MATRLLPPAGETASCEVPHSTATAYDYPPSPPLSPPLLTSALLPDEDGAEGGGHTTPLVFRKIMAKSLKLL